MVKCYYNNFCNNNFDEKNHSNGNQIQISVSYNKSNQYQCTNNIDNYINNDSLLNIICTYIQGNVYLNKEKNIKYNIISYQSSNNNASIYFARENKVN